MLYAPADVIAGPAAIVFGFILVAAALLVIWLIETVALRLLRWGSFGRSLRDAFLMNLASAIVGFIVAGWLLATGSWLPVLFAALFLSVLIEGLVLTALRGQQSTGRAWRASAGANLASYGLLAVLGLLLGV